MRKTAAIIAILCIAAIAFQISIPYITHDPLGARYIHMTRDMRQAEKPNYEPLFAAYMICASIMLYLVISFVALCFNELYKDDPLNEWEPSKHPKTTKALSIILLGGGRLVAGVIQKLYGEI